MKIGFLSDIHGNLEALQAVLEAIDEAKVDRIICLGDVVGYGASPGACIHHLKERDIFTVAGNHDWAALGRINTADFNPVARAGMEWTQDILTPDEIEFLEDLPLIEIFGPVTLFHSTLLAPEQFDYIMTPWDAKVALDLLETPIGFYGHTHVPVTFLRGEDQRMMFTKDYHLEITPGQQTIVNVGSVGQPRDEDPRAAFALYDIELATVDIRRIEYDVEKAAAKIVDCGLPKELGERLKYGR